MMTPAISGYALAKKQLTKSVLLLCVVLWGSVPLRSQEVEDASLLPPKIVTNLTGQYADDARQFQGIASLEVCSNTCLWSAWYTGGNGEEFENSILVSFSKDAGETWSTIMAIDPDEKGPVRAFDPSLWHDPDGNLWLFWQQSYHYYDGRCGVWAMKTAHPEDGKDALWSDPVRLCDGIMMNKPTVDREGRWLYPVAVWRHPHTLNLDTPKGAFCYVSRNKGKTVTQLGQIYLADAESIHDEQMIVQRKDGSLKMYLRTTYGIGESVSTDRGKTWTDTVPSKIKNTSSRFFIRRLQSGALLLVKNGPIDQDVGRCQLTAYISDDDGETWTGGLMFEERGDTSYPDGGQSDDGVITIVYDFNRFSDREILCTRFTEEDVRQGKFVSPQCKTRILINKATGQMP